MIILFVYVHYYLGHERRPVRHGAAPRLVRLRVLPLPQVREALTNKQTTSNT